MNDDQIKKAGRKRAAKTAEKLAALMNAPGNNRAMAFGNYYRKVTGAGRALQKGRRSK